MAWMTEPEPSRYKMQSYCTRTWTQPNNDQFDTLPISVSPNWACQGNSALKHRFQWTTDIVFYEKPRRTFLARVGLTIWRHNITRSIGIVRRHSGKWCYSVKRRHVAIWPQDVQLRHNVAYVTAHLSLKYRGKTSPLSHDRKRPSLKPPSGDIAPLLYLRKCLCSILQPAHTVFTHYKLPVWMVLILLNAV